MLALLAESIHINGTQVNKHFLLLMWPINILLFSASGPGGLPRTGLDGSTERTSLAHSRIENGSQD
jgi:hypothetical protein